MVAFKENPVSPRKLPDPLFGQGHDPQKWILGVGAWGPISTIFLGQTPSGFIFWSYGQIRGIDQIRPYKAISRNQPLTLWLAFYKKKHRRFSQPTCHFIPARSGLAQCAWAPPAALGAQLCYRALLNFQTFKALHKYR